MFDLNKKKDFDQQLKELELAHEALKRDRQKLMEELNITDAELAHNLTEENIPQALQSQIHSEREKLEEALDKARTTKANPKETLKKQQDLGKINQNWLFIR